jgi:hypothetical protein
MGDPNTEEQYNTAIAYARVELSQSLRDEPHFWKGDAYLAGMARHMGKNSRAKTGEHLLEKSKSSHLAFVTLKEGLAALLEEGHELSEQERNWLVRWLREEISQPRKRGAKGKAFAHFEVYQIVVDLFCKDINPFRNEASLPLSGCDAVADAMGELGLEPCTYSSVKSAFTKMRKTMRSLKRPNNFFELF